MAAATFSGFLSKFTDVANLGKLVTDVAPGFLVCVSALAIAKKDEEWKVDGLLESLSEIGLGILFVSLVIGIVLSQVMGQTLYNDAYRRLFLREASLNRIPVEIRRHIRNDEGIPTDIAYFLPTKVFNKEQNEEYEALIRNYYRYLEIAMNMVLPSLFIFVSLVYRLWPKNGSQEGFLAVVGVSLAGIAIITQLVRGGYDYYWHYKVKTAEFVRGMWNELNATSPIRPVNRAPAIGPARRGVAGRSRSGKTAAPSSSPSP